MIVSLQRVPEPRVGKNRVHLDLNGNRATEVPRLVSLGARVIEEHEVPGTAWTVLADPEGNVFCVGEDDEEMSVVRPTLELSRHAEKH